MADDDTPDDGPSLGMPSLSLRRKKKPVEVPAGTTDGQAASTTDVPHGPSRIVLPALSGIPAAAVTGAVVGGLAVLLTWLSTTACDAVRGTPSCGGGPGFLILVAILVVLAYAGALLLGAFGVADAASTSVLAVGVTAVLVMLFLLDSIDEGWMVIAIPVVAVIAYVGSWWVTDAVADNG